MPAPSDKRIVIIAGPNGAGKTTFARQYLSIEGNGLAFLNADEIAAELCPEAPEKVAIRAGRMMLEQIKEHINAGKSFALETTLSGRGYARAIPKWREEGFHVRLIFLRVPDPELSILRVASRVRQGGHHIPEEAIRRRFDLGLKNFYTLYQRMVDDWMIFDNATPPAQLLESGSNY